MLDLDHFKRVNDSFGHQAGDQVLKVFASIIKKEVRDYDTAARFGGEEFMILFEDCEKAKAEEILIRIQEKVKAITIQSGEEQIHFTFSAGIVESSETETKVDIAESLISIADFRLYLAKDMGRDRIVMSNIKKRL
jgi:diguanylate cyclase (GGDEF)-like protein